MGLHIIDYGLLGLSILVFLYLLYMLFYAEEL
jgi:hypothetical protein